MLLPSTTWTRPPWSGPGPPPGRRRRSQSARARCVIGMTGQPAAFDLPEPVRARLAWAGRRHRPLPLRPGRHSPAAALRSQSDSPSIFGARPVARAGCGGPGRSCRKRWSASFATRTAPAVASPWASVEATAGPRQAAGGGPNFPDSNQVGTWAPETRVGAREHEQQRLRGTPTMTTGQWSVVSGQWPVVRGTSNGDCSSCPP